jgi:hypothetical protein
LRYGGGCAAGFQEGLDATINVRNEFGKKPLMILDTFFVFVFVGFDVRCYSGKLKKKDG